jgi:hypothetical protein
MLRFHRKFRGKVFSSGAPREASTNSRDKSCTNVDWYEVLIITEILLAGVWEATA